MRGSKPNGPRFRSRCGFHTFVVIIVNTVANHERGQTDGLSNEVMILLQRGSRCFLQNTGSPGMNEEWFRQPLRLTAGLDSTRESCRYVLALWRIQSVVNLYQLEIFHIKIFPSHSSKAFMVISLDCHPIGYVWMDHCGMIVKIVVLLTLLP